MWYLWWKKWHWGRFSPSTSVSFANSHSTRYSTLIIYHPGLVQKAKYWPTYQVDSVSPHPKKLKEPKRKKQDIPKNSLPLVQEWQPELPEYKTGTNGLLF
jgi:hypothetical protein